MLAPIACRPLTCWATGRKPMAQPPGSDTLALPQRASSGPRTRTEARIVFTSSYGAVGSEMLRACRTTCPSLPRSTSTPMRASSFAMVETSIRRGTRRSASGCEVSSAAHMIGSAAFFAPEMRTSPCSGPPPVMRSLSTALPLRGGQGAHRKRVDLLAHAVAERGVNQLVPLHAATALESRRYDERLEVLAVARDLAVPAGEARLDAGLDALCAHHVIASACTPT